MITMKEAADAVGIGVPVLRFLLAFIASIPCSWLWRFAPSVQARHLFAAVSGAILSYWAFGAQSNIYFLLPIFASYTAMVLDRRHCGIITFIVAFGILVFWYSLFHLELFSFHVVLLCSLMAMVLYCGVTRSYFWASHHSH